MVSLTSAVPATWKLQLLKDDAMPSATKLRQLFSKSGIVIGAHGAALANALFCRSPAALIEITMPQPHAHYYAHLAAALGLIYWSLPANATWAFLAKFLPMAPLTSLSSLLQAAIGELEEGFGQGLSKSDIERLVTTEEL